MLRHRYVNISTAPAKHQNSIIPAKSVLEVPEVFGFFPVPHRLAILIFKFWAPMTFLALSQPPGVSRLLCWFWTLVICVPLRSHHIHRFLMISSQWLILLVRFTIRHRSRICNEAVTVEINTAANVVCDVL